MQSDLIPKKGPYQLVEGWKVRITKERLNVYGPWTKSVYDEKNDYYIVTPPNAN